MTQIKPLLVTTLVAGVLVVLAAWAIGGRDIGIGAVAGAVFSFANLAAFGFIGSRVFAGRKSGALLTIKMAVNALVVFLLVKTAALDPRGIAIGYGALILGLGLAAPTLLSEVSTQKET